MMCDCKQLEVWTNITTFVICYGREDILNCFREAQWDTDEAEQDLEDNGWHQYRNPMFSMRSEDDGTLDERYPGIYQQRTKSLTKRGEIRLIAPLEKWIKVCGRGILASTEV